MIYLLLKRSGDRERVDKQRKKKRWVVPEKPQDSRDPLQEGFQKEGS